MGFTSSRNGVVVVAVVACIASASSSGAGSVVRLDESKPATVVAPAGSLLSFAQDGLGQARACSDEQAIEISWEDLTIPGAGPERRINQLRLSFIVGPSFRDPKGDVMALVERIRGSLTEQVGGLKEEWSISSANFSFLFSRAVLRTDGKLGIFLAVAFERAPDKSVVLSALSFDCDYLNGAIRSCGAPGIVERESFEGYLSRVSDLSSLIGSEAAAFQGTPAVPPRVTAEGGSNVYNPDCCMSDTRCKCTDCTWDPNKPQGSKDPGCEFLCRQCHEEYCPPGQACNEIYQCISC